MIGLFWLDGKACPMFRCDVCGRRIGDVSLAMAAWGELLDSDSDVYVPLHVHKGVCLRRFESRLRIGETLMTAELVEHLQQLLVNSQIKPRQPRPSESTVIPIRVPACDMEHA